MTAGGGPGAGVDALAPAAGRRAPPASSRPESKIGCSSWIQVARASTRRIASLALIRPSSHHVDGDAHGGEAGALAVAALQHVELALLDGELDVLHVAVVLLERAAHLHELLVDSPAFLRSSSQIGERRADAGDHVLALGVDQVLAVEDVLAGGRVAREGDAGAAVVAHVAEHHRLHVGRRAPALGDVVLPAVDDGAVVVPRAEDGADGAPQLLVRVVGEVACRGALDERLERVDQLLERVGV